MPFTPTADLWTRLQRNFARLEEEKYYPRNVYQRAKEHEKWPGDTEGRTLLAWVLLAQATARPPRYLAEMLALWPAEINARGYFGKIYTDGLSEQQLSSHGWVLQALAELHRAAQAGHPWATPHDARALALPIIENLFLPTAPAYAAYPIAPTDRSSAGAYSGSHQKQIGQWILSTDIGCFTIGMTGLIDACQAFDLRDRLTPMIEAMIARFLQIDLDPIQAQTHATLTACRGLLRWADYADRPDLIPAAQRCYDLYTDLAWTETYANYNWFDRPRWTEPCAMVDSLMVAVELWRHLGDTRYLDHAQLITFNALGHGFRANGGYGCDTCPGADGSPDLAFSTYESHWCCTMRGAEGLFRLTEYQVIENPDDGTLTLPFGLPGDYHNGARRLRIESTYPLAADWTFTNTGQHPLTIKLYIPHWITDLAPAPFILQNSYLILLLAPGETQALTGTLTETTRPLLPATLAFIERHQVALTPAPADCCVHIRGPLLLAQLPAHLDEQGTAGLRPIYQAYLDGITHKAHSPRRLICQSTSQIRITEDEERLILEPAVKTRTRFVEIPGCERPILSITGRVTLRDSEVIDPLDDEV